MKKITINEEQVLGLIQAIDSNDHVRQFVARTYLQSLLEGDNNGTQPSEADEQSAGDAD